MSDRNSFYRPDMKFHVMDACNMTYPREHFDMILDKSTIDSVLCGKACFYNTALMLKECQRVLKTGGYYVCITLGAPEERELHFKRPHLDFEIKKF